MTSLRAERSDWPRRAGATALAVVVLAAIVALRRPTGLTQSTIWAEDGQEFMAQAWSGDRKSVV